MSKHEGLDYKIFVGTGQGAESAHLPDDVVLLPDVDDGYGFLTYKTRASLKWAHERGYSHVLRAFPDTYIRVDRLMASGFESADYWGDFRGDSSFNSMEHGRAQNYASGGPGYWLSMRAYSLVIDFPILGVWRDSIMPYVEDLWIGHVLGRTFIGLLPPLDPPLLYVDDQHRFINRGSRPCAWPRPDNDFITAHLSCPDHPKDNSAEIARRMYAAHEPWR